MTNDAWTSLLDLLPAELRPRVLQHAIEAQTSVMAASNAHIEGIRGQFARYIGNQEMILDHLKRQDQQYEKLITEVGAIRTQQLKDAKERRTIIKRLGQVETDMREVKKRLSALEERTA